MSDVPRTRCEQSLEIAVYCSSTRVSVCRAVVLAVAVGREVMYERRASSELAGPVCCDRDIPEKRVRKVCAVNRNLTPYHPRSDQPLKEQNLFQPFSTMYRQTRLVFAEARTQDRHNVPPPLGFQLSSLSSTLTVSDQLRTTYHIEIHTDGNASQTST